MKTIDDLLNNLPDNSPPGVGNEKIYVTVDAKGASIKDLYDAIKSSFDISDKTKEVIVDGGWKEHESTIEMMKEYQYTYAENMHKRQVELAKIIGISKLRQGEIKKM